MTEPEIRAFLTHLAIEAKVSASTQNQALSAIPFLYRHVIHYEIGDLGGGVRACAQARALARRAHRRIGASDARSGLWLK
jgi:hypothetical protein